MNLSPSMDNCLFLIVHRVSGLKRRVAVLIAAYDVVTISAAKCDDSKSLSKISGK